MEDFADQVAQGAAFAPETPFCAEVDELAFFFPHVAAEETLELAPEGQARRGEVEAPHDLLDLGDLEVEYIVGADGAEEAAVLRAVRFRLAAWGDGLAGDDDEDGLAVRVVELPGGREAAGACNGRAAAADGVEDNFPVADAGVGFLALDVCGVRVVGEEAAERQRLAPRRAVRADLAGRARRVRAGGCGGQVLVGEGGVEQRDGDVRRAGDGRKGREDLLAVEQNRARVVGEGDVEELRTG